MYLTGFADEAAADIDGQIAATQELGWRFIEARNVGGVSIHDIPDEQFDLVYGKLQDSGISINCFGSAIANWAKQIDQPFDSSLEEAKRAIPRMQKLGTRLVRIMSFAVLKDREPDDQMEHERFKRLRELHKMFTDAGLEPVHENCNNYGGMGYTYTLLLLENVPGLKLVFDTGNPVGSYDRSKAKPYPIQSAWEFYSHVKDHVAYVHVKDGHWDAQKGAAVYTYPGEGNGDVRKIVSDLVNSGYDGGFSIEPHMSVVHHDPNVTSPEQIRYNTYVEYGRLMQKIIDEILAEKGSSLDHSHRSPDFGSRLPEQPARE